MYGTCARMVVKAENRDAIRAVFDDDQPTDIKGYVGTYVLNENDSDAVWLLVVFEDRASYDKNANDPAQHERFMEMRGLLEADPEWHDGMIMEG